MRGPAPGSAQPARIATAPGELGVLARLATQAAAAQLRPRTKSKKPKSAPKPTWDNWPTIRGHFAQYGADKNSIAWLEVAEKVKMPFPRDVGHATTRAGRDDYAEHVLGVLRDYIASLREHLQLIDSNPKAARLTYWKQRYDIA